MRKTIATILVVLVAVMTVAAVPVRFIFADLNQHTELLSGFLPTYTLVGAGFDFSGDSENTSELQTLVGGGFTQRRVWQNPVTGKVDLELNKKDDGKVMGITYDVIQSDLMLRYIQGMLDDKLTFRFGLEGKFEKNQDSFKKDKNASLDTFLGSTADGIYKEDIYPDLTGNKMSLGAILNLRIKYDIMDDTLVTSDGFETYLDLRWAPGFINSFNGFGRADFYSISFNAVAAKTLYEVKTDKWRWFSIVLIDRANINWTDGKDVPVYAQGAVSLGRKVRGYNTNTYNMQFTAVNNLDLRLALPPMGTDQIRPRINLFLDFGYGCGEYHNTDYTAKDMLETSKAAGQQWLGSVGAQFEMSFWDMIDLGYQIAYIFNGETFTQAGATIKTGFTFFLDF